MFKVQIDTSNAAFDDSWPDELVRILRKIATEIENDQDTPRNAYVFDAGGNHVGRYGSPDKSRR